MCKYLIFSFCLILSLIAFSDDAAKAPDKKQSKSLPSLTKGEEMVLRHIGGKLNADGNIVIGKIIIDRKNGEIKFPAKTCLWNGPLEVLISTQSGRLHESLLVTDIDPFQLQLALVLSGAKNGARYAGGDTPQGTVFDLYVQPDEGSREPVENWITNQTTKKNKVKDGWVFIGATFQNRKCVATREGNIALIWSFGDSVLDNPSETGNNDEFFIVDKDRLKKIWDAYKKNRPNYEGEVPVTVFMRPRKAEAAK